MDEIEKCYNIMGFPLNESEIDSVHGIGSPSWIRNGIRKLDQY